MRLGLASLLAIAVSASGMPLPASAAPAPQTTDGSPIALKAVNPPPEPTDHLLLGEAESRMTVPVSIAGQGPYDFIIDTGAERTVVSHGLATLLQLRQGPPVHVTAMSDARLVQTVVVPSLKVSHIDSFGIEAPALEEGNLGAPGMLGIDALQGHSVTIDFDRHEMAVTPSSARDLFHADPDEIVVKARNRYGQLIVTDASYHGRRIAVVIDTGSPITVGNLAFQRKLAAKPKSLGTATMISALGGTLVAGYYQIDSLEVGNVRFHNVPIAFANAEPFKRFGLTDTPALLLGMDALRLFHHVQIDFANREIRFQLPTVETASN